MSTETKIGRIEYAKFGHCGYQECQFGLSLGFQGRKDGWGVGASIIGGWSYSLTSAEDLAKPDNRCKWTEKDRQTSMAKMAREVDELLTKAKVGDVSQLVGIPVEVTFENNTLKDWRVLEEAL
jgi:hypothetical protein